MFVGATKALVAGKSLCCGAVFAVPWAAYIMRPPGHTTVFLS